MRKTLREILISSLALMIIAGVVTAALAGTNALTEGTIAKQTAEIENAARKEVISADVFEKAKISLDGEEVLYYIAKKNGAVVGYVFTATATGKSSGLTVMTGIGVDGKITGVVITDDNETAGYVDKVIKGGFLDKLVAWDANNKVVLNEDIDAVSQATKTSSGVCKAVNQAIAWYKQVKGGAAGE